jgi:hypothetical protein
MYFTTRVERTTDTVRGDAKAGNERMRYARPCAVSSRRGFATRSFIQNLIFRSSVATHPRAVVAFESPARQRRGRDAREEISTRTVCLFGIETIALLKCAR